MPISEIITGKLWLGGDNRDFRDDGDLDVYGITHFVCVCMGCLHHVNSCNHRNPAYPRHVIHIDDDPSAEIESHFRPARTFINDALRAGGKVLVHCLAGVSRSVTIVAAYLMMEEFLTVEEALSKIRKTRPQADPNAGFLIALHALEFESGKLREPLHVTYQVAL